MIVPQGCRPNAASSRLGSALVHHERQHVANCQRKKSPTNEVPRFQLARVPPEPHSTK